MKLPLNKSETRKRIRLGKLSRRMISAAQDRSRASLGMELSSPVGTVASWYLWLPLLLVIEVLLFFVDNSLSRPEFVIKIISQIVVWPPACILFFCVKRVYRHQDVLNVVDIRGKITSFRIDDLEIVLAPDEPEEHWGMPLAVVGPVVLRSSDGRYILFFVTIGFLARKEATRLREFLDAVRLGRG